MEEMIIDFFVKYGWQLTLIALGGIVVLGAMKTFKIFDKIPKEKQKYIYAIISTGFSIIGSMIYLLATKGFEWTNFLLLSGVLYVFNQSIYAAYETYGIRNLVRFVARAIKRIFRKNKTDDDEIIE